MADLYASVDLGGTNIKCAFAGAEGVIVTHRSVPTESHEGPDAVMARIGSLVNEMATDTGIEPTALGMGVPGLVDLPNGATKFLPNMPTQWRDVPVRDTLSPKIGCPVYLLNDVRTATLGELAFGHGADRPKATMVFLALGTGIGGGIVVDGRLRLGPLGAAGELGHMTVVPDGRYCGCGSRGCIETLASGPAIAAEGARLLLSGLAPKLHEITDGDAAEVNSETMTQAAEAGDESVRVTLERAARYLGIAVGNIMTALHPDLVVLGGGVAQIGPILFDTVRATVNERVKMFPAESVDILPSKLGERAGALGGIALAMKDGLLDEQ